MYLCTSRSQSASESKHPAGPTPLETAQLNTGLWLCRTAEAGRDDSNAKLVAASTELRARRTAYELLHTDWLASQEDLKAHRHVLARLDSM